MHTYIHTCIHAYIHTCMHLHTYIRGNKNSPMLDSAKAVWVLAEEEKQVRGLAIFIF